MRVLFVLLQFLFLASLSSCYDNSDVKCLVCKATTKEIQNRISQESGSKTIDVGGYAMDTDGNVKKKRKLLVQSEIFLTEIMDEVCKKMADYAKATRKDNGELVLINLGDMSSSPKMGEVDFVQDGDLNRSLEHICKGIIEEYDDDLLEVFGRSSANPVEDICVKATDLCDSEEEIDSEDRDEL